jgi:hypothetical protein
MKISTLKKITAAMLLKFVVLVLLSGCATSREADSWMYFTTIGRIPVIEGKINGKRAFFIIDTGASCSILDEGVSEKFGFNFGARADERVHSLAGEARMHKAFDCVVEVGPLRLQHGVFRTRQLQELASAIRKHDEVDIAGIIGSDIFNKYRMSIDFKRNTILF